MRQPRILRALAWALVLTLGGCSGGSSFTSNDGDDDGNGNGGPAPAPALTDLDLFLYRANCSDSASACTLGCDKNASSSALVAKSTNGGGRDEELVVPASGTYYLEVCVNRGASNYVLNVGQPNAAARLALPAPRLRPSFDAGGLISAPASSAVDSDVNEPNAPFASNDRFALAQDIPNPATLGGWLNEPGTGPAFGRLSAAGDPRDLYRLSVIGGQSVRLTIADQQFQSTAAAPPPFVPGEVVVRFRDRFAGDRAAFAGALGLRAAPGQGGRVELLGIDDAQQALAALGADTRRVAEAGDPAARARAETLAVVEALRARPEVLAADPNYYRYPLLTPNDTLYPSQWHYPLINLPQAWGSTTGAATVTVAVIDTGVVLAHPDLEGQLVPGFDFISNRFMSGDGDGIDVNPDDPGDGALPGESSFHGTHVAGTVAARTDGPGNPSPGVAGVAWGVKVMPLRVLGIGGGTSFDTLQALLYAAGLPNAADPGGQAEARVDVVNLSLGGPGNSAAEQLVFDDVRDRGVIVIAAAGNENTSQPSYPAAYDGVVSVSAVTPTKTRAPYSNFGASIDIAAPGGDLSRDVDGDGFDDGVLSTAADDSSGAVVPTYRFYNGTSMAAPHVAGVAALMRSINPALTPAEFDAFLAQGALTEDLGGDGPATRNNTFGYGLIDASKAVVAAGGDPPPPLLSVTPRTLNFGTALGTLSLNAVNGGGGDLSLAGATTASTDAGGDWLTIAAPGGDPLALGAYQVTVERDGLDEGIYTGTIRFDSDQNDVEVRVVMQVSDNPLSGNAGHQFVLLLNANNLFDIRQLDLSPVGGAYVYTFGNVDPGDYLIISGTDNDFDGFICDRGESCGGYPALGIVEPVSVTADTPGLDFLVSYELVVGGQSLLLPSGERLDLGRGIPRPGFDPSKRIERRP